jgi:predicted DNA-binding antitoxin AbrB/MazE fold protein
MSQMILGTGVYQDGVLKLKDPLPGLADGDRVEVVVVRVAPLNRNAPEEVARQERILKAFDERTAALMATEPDGGYEENCRALDEARESNRKLFPPELKGITW